MAQTEVDRVVQQIDKECGGIVESGVEKNDYDRIPFSSPRLNYMTFGGLPLGHIRCGYRWCRLRLGRIGRDGGCSYDCRIGC